jgi:hypothetical protein
MIDPASSWFEIVELPVTTEAVIPMDTKGLEGTKTHKTTKSPYFNKSSAMIIGGCTTHPKRPVMSVCLSHLEKCDACSLEQPEHWILAIFLVAFCKYYN